MSVIKEDEFHADGTRMFNPTKPHGTVYGGNANEARWIQDNIEYRGDRLPVGHTVAEKPTISIRRSSAN